MIGPIFYDERMSVQDVASYSPSAGKPARFMSLIESHYRPLPVRSFAPATLEDLYLVHSRQHVDAVFAGEVPNGFGNTDPRVPQACLWTVGSMVAAALHAPRVPCAVCSPTSGFHHAGYDFSDGFCTFNGLMVAAAKFLLSHPEAKVGILDCDYHYGNGTQDILDNAPWLAEHVLHWSAGQYFCPDGDRAEFFAWLHEAIETMNSCCDLVIYQAGADMHIDDPLGGLLDTADMRKRDRAVMRGIRAPLVWNLAGGYQRADSGSIHDDPVLELHRQTMMESNASDGIRHAYFQERQS